MDVPASGRSRWEITRSNCDPRTGFCNTYAYLSPEQKAGRLPDTRSDQFAFAVALREALEGTRTLSKVPVAPSVPPRIARAIERALSDDPAARHASVEAFLAEILPPPQRPRRGRWIAAACGAISLGAVWWLLRGGATDDAAACGSAASARYDEALPLAIRARLAPRVSRILDDYGHAWIAMAHDSCLATRRGQQSDAMLDLRMTCLDGRLDELHELATIAADATTPLDVSAATRAAYALSSIEPCADRDRLAGVIPAPPSLRPVIAALRHRLDSVRAKELTRAFKEALAELAPIAQEARGIGYPPLLGEVLVVRGLLENRVGEPARADASLQEAITQASAGRADELLTQSWTARVFVTGIMQDHHAVALAYAEAAESAAARTGNVGLARERILSYFGEIQRRGDQLAAAQTRLEEAVRRLEQAKGPSHPLVAESLDRLASVYRQQGDLTAARKAATRALAIYEASYGPEHQDTATVLDTLAAIDVERGDLAAGLAGYREVSRRLRGLFGDDHVEVALVRTNVGQILRRMGKDDEARTELEAARTVWQHTTGLGTADAINTLSDLAKLTPDLPAKRRALEVLARRIAVLGEGHHAVADTLNDLANVAQDLGELDVATELDTRALHIYEHAMGATNPRVSVALSNLGDIALLREHWSDALDACTRALAIDEPKLGAQHPDLAYDLACIGRARLGRGDAVHAVTELERALHLREGADIDPADRAITQYALARALWSSAGDRTRARTLATAAAKGAGSPSTRDEITRWLASH